MRILHIDTGKDMRGGQYQVLLLMRTLRRMDYESTLLARKGGALWDAAAQSGFEVRGATHGEVWRESARADIVHAHDARAHVMAAIASRRKFVVSRRVAFPVRRSLVSTWKYRRPARFLAVSRFVAAQLHAAGVSEDKIDVVYDGVAAVPCNARWRAENPIVALASRDPEKGRDLVEKAMKLAGVDVKFSNDLASDLQQASAFVYITRSEGLGSAALRAMSVGVPVIASCVGGLTEVLIDGASGILVRNNAVDIARAMKSVVEQETLARRLIEGGKARIQECFTEEHLARGTLESYDRALAA